MTSFVSHTTVDCANAYELSEWWKALLGYVDVADDPNEPGHEECMILDPETGHHILFIEVPDARESKQRAGKNRLHFDLRPRDRSRDEEVERLLGVGATAGRRPPRHVRPGHRLGRPRRPRGQRVLHPAVPGRASLGAARRPSEVCRRRLVDSSLVTTPCPARPPGRLGRGHSCCAPTLEEPIS